jgi:hypothetical protein
MKFSENIISVLIRLIYRISIRAAYDFANSKMTMNDKWMESKIKKDWQ